MTPRLAVTQEQVDRWDELYDGAPADCPPRELRLRLPERPTMPTWQPVSGLSDKTKELAMVPIPEGTRVEVGYRDVVTRDDWPEYPDVRWVTVAFATLTEVHAALADGQPYRWHVTLSDIKPVEADQ